MSGYSEREQEGLDLLFRLEREREQRLSLPDTHAVLCASQTGYAASTASTSPSRGSSKIMTWCCASGRERSATPFTTWPFPITRDYAEIAVTPLGGTPSEFEWPRPTAFNWALDYFDRITEGNDRRALWVVDEDGGERTRTFAELSRRSNQVANHLRDLGLRRGDRMLVMLGSVDAHRSVGAAGWRDFPD